MRSLEGRVAIVTGAGRGLGREHALALAAAGASVVVNDLGGTTDGHGEDRSVAESVVDEIVAAGGTAIADGSDIAHMAGAGALVQRAIEAFGDLHVLVNNAGILRDRTFVNMTEDEWDEVVRVHLRGHFCPTKHAVAYWRAQSKAGREVQASIVHTTSSSGLHLLLPGQTNYAAAKAGVAAFALVLAKEVARYGVRVNTIAPGARTRLALQTPGLGDRIQPPEDPEEFDPFDPANVAPVVVYLAEGDCPLTGATLEVSGGIVNVFETWHAVESLEKSGRWTPDELRAALKPRAEGASIV